MASPGPLSDYEAQRAARIADNRKRMADMGLADTLKGVASAASAAAAAAAPPRRPRAPARRRPAAPAGPARRSGRVAGLPPTDEVGLVGTGSSDRALAAPAATYAREAYGPESLHALGTVADGATWQLFVDGYDAKRKRIYDNGGHTCHQCRQKVRATFTACAHCGLLRGGFCGDCLYMRYGEHVGQVRARNEEAAAAGGVGAHGGGGGGGDDEEAAAAAAPTTSTARPSTTTPWACPPCRGVCNCSFHRAAAGLPPTGSLYRGALAAGFPSVAHFLVLSRLTPAGRAALAAAAAGVPGPPPPEAWLAAGPGGGTGSDDEEEAALETAAGLWARGVAAGVLGRGVVPASAAAPARE